MIISFSGRTENVEEKGEDSANEHLYPFPTTLSKDLLFRVVKVPIAPN